MVMLGRVRAPGDAAGPALAVALLVALVALVSVGLPPVGTPLRFPEAIDHRPDPPTISAPAVTPTGEAPNSSTDVPAPAEAEAASSPAQDTTSASAPADATPSTAVARPMTPPAPTAQIRTSPVLSPFRGAGLVQLPDACADASGLELAWYYTWWYTNPCPDVRAQFVPMLWGDWCGAAAGSPDCAALPVQLEAQGGDTVLGFNEPDAPEQANVSVDRALDLWAVLARTHLRLGSPATQQGARGDAWRDAFLAGARARGLRVDFLAVHWYGDCGGPDDLLGFLHGLERYGLPIWLTEFSCRWRTPAENAAFVAEMLPLIAQIPAVERVAWFTNRSYADGWEGTALVDGDGAPTAVGKAYAGSPSCWLSIDGDRTLAPAGPTAC